MTKTVVITQPTAEGERPSVILEEQGDSLRYWQDLTITVETVGGFQGQAAVKKAAQEASAALGVDIHISY